MKKSFFPFLIGLLVGAAVLYLVLSLPSSPGKRAAAQGTFGYVSSQLDESGDLYFTYNLERIFPFFENFLRTVGQAVPGAAGKTEPATDKILDIFRQLGFGEMDGLGASSITLDKNLYRTRIVLHHPSGKSQGLIWSALGPNRDLDFLRRLPAETAMASMAEVRFDKLLAWLKTILPPGTSKTPDLAKSLADLEAKGIPLEKMILSLNGPLGTVLTLNPEKKLAFPAAEKPVEIPEPGLAVILTVKDATIFDFLHGRIPGASSSEKGGVRRLQIAVPTAPFPLSPTLILKDGMLIAATTERLAEFMIDGSAKGRLVDTADFRVLSGDMPLSGAGFSYLGPGLMKGLREALRQMAPPQAKPSVPNPLAILDKMFPTDLQFLSIAQNGNEGMTWIIHHTVPLEQMFFLQLAPLLAVPKGTTPAKQLIPSGKF